MQNLVPALAAALPLAFSFSAPLPAQPPSNWTTTTMPANRTSAPNSIGTTVSFLTTDSVWLYSGITKKWTVLPVTNPAPVFQANDYCIVQDGNRIHGFASHTGAVDTITTSGSATIVSGPASSSWVTLVADGTKAYGFGAFHGKWEAVTLSQPNPQLLANRLIGMVHDGNTVYALSAHHGTFVPVAADAAAVPTVVGEAEVGTAHSPGVFRAFSAQHNTWTVQAIPQNASLLQQNEYALAWSGNTMWAYSGLSGTLATYVAKNPIAGIANSEGAAAFVDGGDAVCYGAGRGRFVAMPAQNPALQVDYHFVLVVEPTQITPFSAVTSSYGQPIAGVFIVTTNEEVAFAAGTPSWAYSAIRNAWTLVPPAITPTAIAAVRSAIMVAHGSGYEAFSARYGTWVSQPAAFPNNWQAPARGGTILAIDGANGEIAHVFDARLNRWASVAGAGPLTVQLSRHNAMVHDGKTAFGFGQPSSEWYAEPLSAPPTTFDTASSIGTVVHGNQISVWSVQGSFSYTGRYPEFTQAINLGNTLTLHQVAPAGSAVHVLFGLQPTRIDLGPALGRLYIDPAQVHSFPWPVPVGPTGILPMLIPVPNDPALVGLQLHLQNVVLPPAGSPWLSSSVAPVFF